MKFPAPLSNRNLQLDTVRGIACFLLVAYHAIGSSPSEGLKYPAESWLHALNSAIGYVRMPLFTFLAGYVYSKRPADWNNIQEFLGKKAMRLLVPMIIVGAVLIVLRMITPGVNEQSQPDDFWRYLVFPYAHFWYLQALMVIFALIAVVECSGKLRSVAYVTIVFIAASGLFGLRHSFPEFFSIDRAIYLLPFFIAGLLLARFGKNLLHAVAVPMALLCLFLIVAYACGREQQIDTGLKLLVGIGSSICLTRFMPSVKWIAFVGYYSYTIFLYHVFGSAGVRIALQSVGANDRGILLPLVIAAGLLIPILIHAAVHNIPIASRVLLGIRPRHSSGRFNADRVGPFVPYRTSSRD